MEKLLTDKKIKEMLLKAAKGYKVAEITVEYAEVDGALKLTKRKKTKKDVPPDLKAVQLLLSSEGADYSQWSDEDLEAEKQRLLSVLQEDTETTAAKTVTKKVGTVRKPRAKPRTRVVRKVKTEN